MAGTFSVFNRRRICICSFSSQNVDAIRGGQVERPPAHGSIRKNNFRAVRSEHGFDLGIPRIVLDRLRKVLVHMTKSDIQDHGKDNGIAVIGLDRAP